MVRPPSLRAWPEPLVSAEAPGGTSAASFASAAGLSNTELNAAEECIVSVAVSRVRAKLLAESVLPCWSESGPTLKTSGPTLKTSDRSRSNKVVRFGHGSGRARHGGERPRALLSVVVDGGVW
eukprot:1844063-Prymnesium_polylepis.2